MKISDKFMVLFIGLSVFTVTASSQKSNLSINQAELLRKFEGTWTCEIGKDTIAQWDMIPYGNGFDAKLKYVTGGRIVKEGKGLYGYDKTLDKIVEAGITKGKDIGVYVMWFISDSKWVLIPYSDLAAPEKASFKMEGEFKSPDNLVETNFTNNKSVKTKSWSRIKQ
jgi:hypothetical protein